MLVPGLLSSIGVNTLAANTQLSTPSAKGIDFPNVDTLYATAIFDLSIGDLIVTVPDVDPGRYWSFSFHDP
jgi:hypothetical protein